MCYSDELVLLGIDMSSGFVQNKNFIVSHNCFGQTHQLLLAYAEIRPVIGHFRVKTPR